MIDILPEARPGQEGFIGPKNTATWNQRLGPRSGILLNKSW